MTLGQQSSLSCPFGKGQQCQESSARLAPLQRFPVHRHSASHGPWGLRASDLSQPASQPSEVHACQGDLVPAAQALLGVSPAV